MGFGMWRKHKFSFIHKYYVGDKAKDYVLQMKPVQTLYLINYFFTKYN
jgi:hypothetical protein